MGALLIRAFYIAFPAVLLALLWSIVHPSIGVFAFWAMVMLGLHATKARPERGEGA